MVYAADVGQEFADVLGNVVGSAVRVVIFLVIIALGWFVATWIRKWVTRGLQKAGFDRAVERGGLHRMLGRTSPSLLAARLVMFAFLLFVLQLAFGIFGPNPVSDLIAGVIDWLPKLFVAVIIVVVAAYLAGWIKDLIADALGGVSYGRALATTAQVLVLALGAIAALTQIGIAASVTMPVLIAALAIVAGVIIVGVGGGLIKPMQHRWERILNRAETETTLAAEKVRANRANAATRDRDVNATGGFEQPAYTGSQPDDTKPMPVTPEPAATENEDTAEQQDQGGRRPPSTPGS